MTYVEASSFGVKKGDTVRYAFFFQEKDTRDLDESWNRWKVGESKLNGKVEITQLIPAGARKRVAITIVVSAEDLTVA